MRYYAIFTVAIVAVIWTLMITGFISQFWVRSLGVLAGVFGFLFVFMLTDAISDGMRGFGISLIIIAIALMVIWS